MGNIHDPTAEIYKITLRLEENTRPNQPGWKKAIDPTGSAGFAASPRIKVHSSAAQRTVYVSILRISAPRFRVLLIWYDLIDVNWLFGCGTITISEWADGGFCVIRWSEVACLANIDSYNWIHVNYHIPQSLQPKLRQSACCHQAICCELKSSDQGDQLPGTQYLLHAQQQQQFRQAAEAFQLPKELFAQATQLLELRHVLATSRIVVLAPAISPQTSIPPAWARWRTSPCRVGFC